MLWKMDRGQAEEQFDNVGSNGLCFAVPTLG